jgi:DNA-binding response OmpR family regulator
MSQKHKILLFDDEMDSLSKVYISLLLKDFQVEATTDPNEILRRSRRFRPDLAIVNGDVPGFDGHEVCALLKSEMERPIILLVGPETTTTINIDHCAADAIITKPVDMPGLLQTVRQLLATYQ